MANQRNPQKKRMTVWLLPEEKKALAAMAKKEGSNMGDVIKKFIDDYRNEKKSKSSKK